MLIARSLPSTTSTWICPRYGVLASASGPPAPGAERQRRRQRLRRRLPVDGEQRRRAEGDGAGRERVRLPETVADAVRHVGGERQGLLLVGEQHPDARDRRLADRGAGVVVREDLLGRPAVLGVAVRAVLAHPDAVPPAVAREEEQRPGAGGGDEARSRADGGRSGRGRGRARRERGGGDKEGDRATHHGLSGRVVSADPAESEIQASRGFFRFCEG